MLKPSITVSCMILLGACALTRSEVASWSDYRAEIEHLPPAELEARAEAALDEYQSSPDDSARLRLAFLLGQPGPLQDFEAGLALLAEIDDNGRLADLRDMVKRELRLTSALQSAQRKIDEQALEIRRLRLRVDELDKAGDHQAELARLRDRVRELEAQLEALKSIETDISEDQKAMGELSQ